MVENLLCSIQIIIGNTLGLKSIKVVRTTYHHTWVLWILPYNWGIDWNTNTRWILPMKMSKWFMCAMRTFCTEHLQVRRWVQQYSIVESTKTWRSPTSPYPNFFPSSELKYMINKHHEQDGKLWEFPTYPICFHPVSWNA